MNAIPRRVLVTGIRYRILALPLILIALAAVFFGWTAWRSAYSCDPPPSGCTCGGTGGSCTYDGQCDGAKHCPGDCCSVSENQKGNCNWCPVGGYRPGNCAAVSCDDGSLGCPSMYPNPPGYRCGGNHPICCPSFCMNGGTWYCAPTPGTKHCCHGCFKDNTMAGGCDIDSCIEPKHCIKCSECPCDPYPSCSCGLRDRCQGYNTCDWCPHSPGKGCPSPDKCCDKHRPLP